MNKKLSETNVIAIRKSINSGVSVSELAREYGVDRKCIRNIRDKKTWCWL